MRRILILFCSAWLVLSCGGSQEVVSEKPIPTAERPSWVISRPADGGFYIGIGIASKAINPTDYVQVAKKNALQDLSGEISVNVSSNSMLYQLERNYNFKEEYQNAINITSNVTLEGYEIVGTWENEREFWIYYRLNKDEYARKTRAQKEQAISQSMDLYQRAIDFGNSAQYDRALSSIVKAFQAIRPYLNDALEVQMGDQMIFYGNELFNTYLDWLGEIRVVAMENNLSYLQGRIAQNDYTVFKVEDSQGRNLKGIPVLFGYSGHKRHKTTFISDNDGLINYPIPQTTDKPGRQEIRATLNLEMIVTGATDDPLLIEMLTKPQTQLTVVPIEVLAPSFYIESEEQYNGQPSTNRILARKAEQILLKNDYKIASNAGEANFRIQIITNTENGGTSYNFYTAFLTGTLQVFSGEELVYSYAITRIKGVQNSYERASMDAYAEAAEYLEYEIMRKLLLDMQGRDQ